MEQTPTSPSGPANRNDKEESKAIDHMVVQIARHSTIGANSKQQLPLMTPEILQMLLQYFVVLCERETKWVSVAQIAKACPFNELTIAEGLRCLLDKVTILSPDGNQYMVPSRELLATWVDGMQAGLQRSVSFPSATTSLANSPASSIASQLTVVSDVASRMSPLPFTGSPSAFTVLGSHSNVLRTLIPQLPPAATSASALAAMPAVTQSTVATTVTPSATPTMPDVPTSAAVATPLAATTATTTTTASPVDRVLENPRLPLAATAGTPAASTVSPTAASPTEQPRTAAAAATTTTTTTTTTLPPQTSGGAPGPFLNVATEPALRSSTHTNSVEPANATNASSGMVFFEFF